jgi:hypothetical protein
LNWLKRFLSKIGATTEDQEIHNILKPNESVHGADGVFQYNPSGFTVSYENVSIVVKWNDISQISVFKRDLFTVDRIDMDIVYRDKVLSISEDLPGWDQFVQKAKETFPEIPEGWEADVALPAFAKNLSIIYSRSSDFILTGKILDLKLESLTKVGGDSDWNSYYIDSDGSKWIKSYPNSGYHGGGAPQLTRVERFPNETDEGL